MNSSLQKDSASITTTDSKLQVLVDDRMKYFDEPLIRYLDIAIKKIASFLSFGHFVIKETKLDNKFPSAQLAAMTMPLEQDVMETNMCVGLEFIHEGFCPPKCH